MLVALVIPMVNIEMRTGMGLVLVSSCFVFSVLLSYTGFHVSLLGMKSNNPMTQATAYAGIIMTILLAFTLLATIGLTFYYASAPGSGPS